MAISDVPKVQIPLPLFVSLVKYHLLGENEDMRPGIEAEIRLGLEKKYKALANREEFKKRGRYDPKKPIFS